MADTTLSIVPRYARLYTEPGIPLAEANYQYGHLKWGVPLTEAAVVCIDCWSWHFTRETLARIDSICRERIGPLLAACRKFGLRVIHAPANPVASRDPNFIRLRPADARPQPQWPDSPSWPPADFRAKRGEYAQYAKPAEPQSEARERHREEQRDFHEACRPAGEEAVILDGEDLHRYCAKHRITNLFFLGFNTNACVMMRDYGLPAMVKRGYHGILIRDCTTGMEIAETYRDLVCTRGTIADIEQFLGFTVTAGELVQALSDTN